MRAMLAIGQMYGGARVRVRRYASAGAGVERTRRTRPLGRVTCKEWGPASSLPTPTACCPRRGSFTSRLYRSMHGVAQRPVSSGSIGRLGPDRKPEPWESGAAGPFLRIERRRARSRCGRSPSIASRITAPGHAQIVTGYPEAERAGETRPTSASGPRAIGRPGARCRAECWSAWAVDADTTHK